MEILCNGSLLCNVCSHSIRSVGLFQSMQNFTQCSSAYWLDCRSMAVLPALRQHCLHLQTSPVRPHRQQCLGCKLLGLDIQYIYNYIIHNTLSTCSHVLKPLCICMHMLLVMKCQSKRALICDYLPGAASCDAFGPSSFDTLICTNCV